MPVALLVLVPVAVLVAFLLLWGAFREQEGGAFRVVGGLRVRAGEERADAVVSYALP